MAAAQRSWLALRNPSVKLLLVFGWSLVLTFVFDPWTPTALWLVGVVAAVALGRVPWRTLLVAHLPFATFGLGMLVVNMFTRDGTPVATLGPLTVTDVGLAVGLSLFMRTLAIGIVSVLFIVTTDPVALMVSLHQNLRLPASITYAVLAGHQMLQDLPAEWATIRTAQRLRQADPGRDRLSLRAAGQAAFTLLVVSLRRSERIAQALESRGLGLKPRTVWRPVRLTAGDAVMSATAALLVVGVLLVADWFGILEGAHVLFT